MSTLPSKTFCVIPWVHVFGDERGLLRPCCKTQDSAARAIPNADAAGRVYTVHQRGDLEAGWQSELMRGIRRDMLAGAQPPICHTCYDDEALGLRSYRSDANETFADSIAAIPAATAADGTAPLHLIRSLDVRLGNACNLMCRMCSPVSSKLLIPEWTAILDAGDEPRMAALAKVDWFDRDDFWEGCERLLPSIDQLHFAGGEPMIITRMLDFLQAVIDRGHAGHIELSYVTNLTTLPARVVELWPAFKAVTLTGSLDGPAAINSYIRHPAKWDRIEANVAQLTAHPERYNLERLSFNTTVQAYNVLYLADLFELLIARGSAHVNHYPRLTLLTWPSFFSIQVLPGPLKALAEQRLRAFVDRWTGRWPETGERLDKFLSSIEGVIEHMHAGDRSRELPDFARRTRFFDASRGQDGAAVMPEWARYLAEAAATAS